MKARTESSIAAIDVARVTIQLTTPIAISTGAPDDLVDSMFVTDANGLPAIPGTSLAGVLRDRWKQTGGDAICPTEDLFGDVERIQDGGESRTDCTRSRLALSWAHIHDSRNRPVAMRVDPSILAGDPLLRHAALPIVRQHVRLNARGTADTEQRGLFDEAVVAAGHRFTVELAVAHVVDRKSLRSAPPFNADGDPGRVLYRLLQVLADPATRLGGKTRRGLGAFKLVEAQRRLFDLRDPVDFAAYGALPVDLAAPPEGEQSLPLIVVEPSRETQTAVATLRLRPRGFWFFGGGAPQKSGANRRQGEMEADIVPYREPVVAWTKDAEGHWKGEIDLSRPRAVIPASGVKGALRHRVRFHAFAQARTFAGDPDLDEDFFKRLERGDEPNRDAVLRSLFGEILSPARLKETRRANAASKGAEEIPSASPGKVFLDDILVELDLSEQIIQHVSLDRFTSGPLDGHLFAEEAFWQWPQRPEGGESCEIRLIVRDAAGCKPDERQALHAALTDLAEGRLQIGAGSGRGHGWFEGSLEWAPRDWPEQVPPGENA